MRRGFNANFYANRLGPNSQPSLQVGEEAMFLFLVKQDLVSYIQPIKTQRTLQISPRVLYGKYTRILEHYSIGESSVPAAYLKDMPAILKSRSITILVIHEMLLLAPTPRSKKQSPDAKNSFPRESDTNTFSEYFLYSETPAL